MIVPNTHKGFRSSCFIATVSMLFAVASAIADDKPAPKKPVSGKAAAPAKAAPSAAKGAAPSTSKGPTTSPASHGPTTGGGPTTKGPTTKGPTTSSPHGPTSGPGAAPGGHSPATAHGGPATAHAGPGGSHPVPAGSKMVHTRNGNDVRMRANGRPGDVHVANRGMDIHHGLNGNRRVAVERADHSRIVSERGGRGYVQRPYMYRGHEFAHRTYYYHGRAYDRFYARYPYHGVYVEMYTPAAYYAPAFYGWAYNPWVAPIAYTPMAWGWAGNPWYGYYGAYFTPYPVYPNASFWLTDYMVSTTLAAAYQARMDANAQAQAQAQAQPAPGGDVALTPEVKNMIAAEVQRQIALENAEAQTAAASAAPDPASSGIQRMLTDGADHVLVVGHDLDVMDASGAECAISEGDALQFRGPVVADAIAVNASVLSSKGGQECRRGNTVSVAFADLQDMQNHMRETIDQGMAQLQAKQSTGGLPALPQSARTAPVKTAFAADPAAPGPDPAAATEITQQLQEADRAEQETLAQAAPDPLAAGGQTLAPPPAGAAPATVSLGQSIDEVTAILGQPKNIVDLGAKKIYVYKDLKVTFKDGKVADID